MNEEKEYIPAHPLAFIAKQLEQKGSKQRIEKVYPGELIFDFNGDVIGVYQGNGYILMEENIK